MSGRQRMRRGELLLQALEAATDGPTTVQALSRVASVAVEHARTCLANAVTSEYLQAKQIVGTNQKEYHLREAGRQMIVTLRNRLGMQPTPSLGEKALALIDRAPAGIWSIDLAATLEVLPREIDEALALHVASHRLVSCKIQRAVEGELREGWMYRVSSGVAQPVDWHTQNETNWANRKAAVREIDIDAVHRRHDNVIQAGDAGTPPVAAAPLDSEVARAAKAAARDEFTTLERWSAPPGGGHQVPAGDADDFHIALVSDGRFLLHVDGEQTILNAARTRTLLQYMRNVRCEDFIFSASRSAA